MVASSQESAQAPPATPTATAQILDSRNAAWSDDDAPLPADSRDPSWGERTAPVTIVMFADFECPFCARVQKTLEQLRASYGPKKIRFVWKNLPLPFHPSARAAAEAAMGVFALGGNDAFWRFHALLFSHQDTLNEENYIAWAAEAGVPSGELRKGLEARAWADKVDQDIALSRRVGADGTPTFFINGVSLSGAQPIGLFRATIDAELVKAEAALAKGTRPERIYVEMAAVNLKNPPPRPPTPAPAEDKTVWKVPIGSAPSRGPDTALVTIVEFADFQCPFCRRATATIRQVRETYGSAVRLVFRNLPLPFHPRAEPAAELALFALKNKGSAGFWAAHDQLFEMQPNLEDAALERLANELGLNADRAMQAVHEHKFQDLIDADADVADDFHADGTPTFFINGRRLVGALPFDKFKDLIDEELGKARALVAKGTSASHVYAETMKTAVAPLPPERKEVPEPSASAPVRGRSDAKVVIQEFADFQCPFCARVEPTLKRLLSTYDGKVKLVWRNLPLSFHHDAPLAAEAALEAFRQRGPAGFWRMHDLLIENQASPGGLKSDALVRYARQIGLDETAFESALTGRVHADEVEVDAKAAAAAGIAGTPSFVINGYFVSGAQSFIKFRKVVQRALAESNSRKQAAAPPTPSGSVRP